MKGERNSVTLVSVQKTAVVQQLRKNACHTAPTIVTRPSRLK